MSDDTTSAALGARCARLHYIYARGVDDGDLEALRAIVTDDVLITRGTNPTRQGVRAFLDVYRAYHKVHPVTKHFVTNVLAEQVGEQIRTRAYYQALTLDQDETQFIVGHYDDLHVVADGELKIAHKKIVVERVLSLPPAVAHYTHVETD